MSKNIKDIWLIEFKSGRDRAWCLDDHPVYFDEGQALEEMKRAQAAWPKLEWRISHYVPAPKAKSKPKGAK